MTLCFPFTTSSDTSINCPMILPPWRRSRRPSTIWQKCSWRWLRQSISDGLRGTSKILFRCRDSSLSNCSSAALSCMVASCGFGNNAGGHGRAGRSPDMRDMPQGGTKLRTITLEEHFASPGFIAGPCRAFMERVRSNMGPRGAKIMEQLQDVGAARMAEMDAAGIDMRVLSLNAPGIEQADVAEQVAIARESNDFLADAVKKHPKRFAAFAALPVAAPEQAAEELDRRVRQQGFKGALINGHTRGRYLDDKDRK